MIFSVGRCNMFVLSVSLMLLGCSSARERHANDRESLDTVFVISSEDASAIASSTSENGTDSISRCIFSSKLEIPRLLIPRQEQVIEHIGYTINYNANWYIPNWVAYELTSTEVEGQEPRSNNFAPDPQIAEPVMEFEYKNSGYDRGHMVPAADMKWSGQAMSESFYMSNVCPQNKNLNSKDWLRLEEQVRHVAHSCGNVFVCCGPIVTDSTITIGTIHNIVVPQAFFKVLLRQKGNTYSAIGFKMPNKARDCKRDLSYYAISINELESELGIDFFPALPDEIEEIIEDSYILKDWGL